MMCFDVRCALFSQKRKPVGHLKSGTRSMLPAIYSKSLSQPVTGYSSAIYV
jgi:hypothetical protein